MKSTTVTVNHAVIVIGAAINVPAIKCPRNRDSNDARGASDGGGVSFVMSIQYRYFNCLDSRFITVKLCCYEE